jgi:hypothetical protein
MGCITTTTIINVFMSARVLLLDGSGRSQNPNRCIIIYNRVAKIISGLEVYYRLYKQCQEGGDKKEYNYYEANFLPLLFE